MRWSIRVAACLVVGVLSALPALGQEPPKPPRSCQQELAEAKTVIEILRSRRDAAEQSWAHFFTMVRGLETQRDNLMKQLEDAGKARQLPQSLKSEEPK